MSLGSRRLAAIMYTDMVGYTALGQRNESLSLALVDEQRKLLRPIFIRHNGREVKTIGDAFLVEFPSALEAVRCAYDVQRAAREFNFSQRDEQRLHLRIGVHLGDVIEAEGDISGDAVNVASRIEPLADDGGVCLTQQVYDHVQNKFELPLTSLGSKSLKNVSSPMEVYKMIMPWEKNAGVSEGLDKHRIAVMPLVNMISDPNEEYFADGMTEELISAISKVRELSVISRTSAMHYKNQSKRASDIGRELNVGTLLEGSVRKASNRVRIAVQLIAVEDDRHLWAENYDRSLEDVFAIQTEIASRIADELKIQLVDSEKQTLKEKSTRNTEAYTFFLKGRELLREGSEPSLRSALGLFEKAIDLDPSFARAYSGLASCYQRLGNGGYEPYWESIAKEKVPLMKALELDPELAEAHASLSVMRFNEDDLEGAEAEARQAISLNPSLPEAYDSLSSVAWLKGDIAEGSKLVETCYSLDPIRPSYVSDLGKVMFYLGRENEALEYWKRTVELAPADTYRLMAEYYLLKKDYSMAREFHSKAAGLQPTHPWATWMKGFIAAQTGDAEGALNTIREIQAKRGDSGINEIGFIRYALGDFDSYFECMNRAIELHSLNFVYPMYCPLFERGRADPRYQEFIAKMRKMFWPDKN